MCLPLRCESDFFARGVGYERPDRFTPDDAANVARYVNIKNNKGQPFVHAEREGGRIHDLQASLQYFEVVEPLEPCRVRVELRVGRIDTVDLRRLQNGIGPYFDRAQSRRRVGGEIRV